MAAAAHGRTWGFRFSTADAVAIAICVVATAALWAPTEGMAFLFPFVLGHFFLFCNVFRIARKPELIWAVVFLMNFGGWWLSGRLSWPGVMAIQLPLTAFLIGWEMRQPWYHGILADRINRRHLADYLGESPQWPAPTNSPDSASS